MTISKKELVKNLVKAYKNKSNWEYSEFKGYPKGTYFGFPSFKKLKDYTLKSYREFYGKNFR